MSLLAKLTDLPDGHPNQLDDMERRYSGTYLLKTDDMHIVQYGGHDRTIMQFNDISNNNKPFIIKHADEALIVPFLPKIGYYNIRGVPYYLVKIPQRQWKRSFCSAIYHISDGLGESVGTRGFYSTALPFIATPEYASLDQVSSSLFANIALSRNFAVVKAQDNTAHLVFRKYQIGKLDFESRTVKVYQPTLIQEVLDLFKSTRISTWKLAQTKTE